MSIYGRSVVTLIFILQDRDFTSRACEVVTVHFAGKDNFFSKLQTKNIKFKFEFFVLVIPLRQHQWIKNSTNILSH
jgi:hypothetical protein